MHELSVPHFFANLLVILLSAKLFGELAERWKQPAVIGELLGGVVLGFGLFSFFDPSDSVLSLMAQFGVLLLLFEIGLESDLAQLLKVGPVAFAVAAVGVVVPLILGYAVMRLLGYGFLESVLVGAALTATSVGVTARVLRDLGKLDRFEAQVILGAAVIDDILGLIILSAVQGMARTGAAWSWGIVWTTFLAVLFVGGAIWLGPPLSHRLIGLVDRMKGRGILISAAVSFALALGLVAHAVGTAFIVGAFTAGILLARTNRKTDIRQALLPVADIFVPIFFVMVGAKINLHEFNPLVRGSWSILPMTVLLCVVAVGGKLASAWAVRQKGVMRWPIGVGMIPRGEVGLIFAQVGLASQVIGKPLYTALIGVVVVTTLITPPWLKRAFR